MNYDNDNLGIVKWFFVKSQSSIKMSVGYGKYEYRMKKINREKNQPTNWNAEETWCSETVNQPSTNHAQCSSTSVMWSLTKICSVCVNISIKLIPKFVKISHLYISDRKFKLKLPTKDSFILSKLWCKFVFLWCTRDPFVLVSNTFLICSSFRRVSFLSHLLQKSHPWFGETKLKAEDMTAHLNPDSSFVMIHVFLFVSWILLSLPTRSFSVLFQTHRSCISVLGRWVSVLRTSHLRYGFTFETFFSAWNELQWQKKVGKTIAILDAIATNRFVIWRNEITAANISVVNFLLSLDFFSFSIHILNFVGSITALWR